jgi:hypothetical protein
MHVVQMKKKPEMTIVIPAPKTRLPRPVTRGGKHRDRRRVARSTERVLLARQCEK